jgi:hypothetical protein
MSLVLRESRAMSSLMYYSAPNQLTNVPNQVPYGWCFDHSSGRKMKLSQEQTVIDYICQMRANNMGPQAIAKTLNQAGILSRFGKIWRAEQVLRVLRRDFDQWRESR